MKKDLFQLAANTGLIIGLIVLIYEVRQSNLYAQAESASANSAFSVARESSIVGENLSDVLAKALEDSDSLNMSELVVLDAYHRLFLMELIHWAHESALGVVSDRWKETSHQYIRLHLDYPFGRKWWSHQRHRMVLDPDAQVVAGVIDQALEESDDERLNFFVSLKSDD